MKRLPAMILIGILTVGLASYIAMAPFAGPPPGGVLRPALAVLDQLALQLNAFAGRGIAIMGVLVIGGILALFLGVGRRTAPVEGSVSRRTSQGKQPPTPEQPIFRPEPVSSEDRIAALRRRAGVSESEPGSMADEARAASQGTPDEEPVFANEAAPVPAASEDTVAEPPLPVVLVRKSRDRDRDWTVDPSWLGGLPRLGPAQWPRDDEGRPMAFAAQLDLEELAAACPGCPLPDSGALAFFICRDARTTAGGAVVSVPDGVHDFTDPPEDLPPAYAEGGLTFPEGQAQTSRAVFPFWPVEMVPVSMAPQDNLPSAIAARIGQQQPQTGFAASLGNGSGEPLWWYGVYHLADRLHDLATMADEAMNENARDERGALGPMIAALEHFVEDRAPWERLTDEEAMLVNDILAEIHRAYPALIALDGRPLDRATLASVAIKAMMTGAPDAFAALPDDILEHIQAEHALPPGGLHCLFAPTHATGEGRMILLQLAGDDLMQWHWDANATVRFTIAAADAGAGHWLACTVALVDD